MSFSLTRIFGGQSTSHNYNAQGTYVTTLVCSMLWYNSLCWSQVVEVKVRGITLLLEERLLFKLIQWAGLGGKGAWSGPGSSNEDEEEIMKMLSHR